MLEHQAECERASGELLEPALGGPPRHRRLLVPAAVGAHLPRQRVVGQVRGEELGEAGAEPGIGDRRQRLDPAVEVPGHEVGRTDEVLGLHRVGTEAVDPGVLEEPADDRSHPDGLRQPRDAGAETADATRDEVDRHAALRRRIQRLDHARVDERVHLHRDATTRALRRFTLDAVDHRLANVRRRDEQLAVEDLVAVAGEVVEQVGEVGAEVGVGGEQAEVFVAVRGLAVVVAGSDVAVPPDAFGFLAHDEQDLGVRLQPHEAVHDVHARFFEDACTFDVRLLVEAGRELDERDDLLALFGGLDQRADDRGSRARRCGRWSA